MVTHVNSVENKQPKVSILVPIYKVEAFIEKCANSLFEQTYENIEYVFVNDCTPDNSIKILNNTLTKYPNRAANTKIIKHSSNKGIGAARKTLLSSATGDYILWVDSDDFISENAVEVLVAAIMETESDIVTSDSYNFYNGEKNLVTFSQKLPENSKQYIEALTCHQSRAALWGTLSKKSLWLENDITILESSTYGEDYFATVQLFYFSTRNRVIHFPFYYYNQTNINSYTTGHKSEKHFESLIKLFDNLLLFFQKQNVESEFGVYLKKAAIKEFSGLLLHTTANLRRKYRNVLKIEDLNCFYNKVDINKWQYVLLKQIILGRYLYSDLLIFTAKLLRMIFNLKF